MNSIIELLKLTRIHSELPDNRYIFNVYLNDIRYIRLLFDTGAQDSVWCSTEKALISLFPKATSLKGSATVNGFGKLDIDKYPIYSIPEVKIDNLVLQNVPVIVKPSSFPFSLILQADTFDTVEYTVRNRVMKIRHDKPIRFTPYIDNNRMYVGSRVQVEESTPVLSDDSAMYEGIPVDVLSRFKDYAEEHGITEDVLVDRVYSCLSPAMLNPALSKLQNALKYWDTYEKVMR